MRVKVIGSRTLIGLLALLVFSLSACSMSGFSIVGTWKSVGAEGWGQAQPGSVIQFGNGQANLYSPRDTYALYKDGDVYKLTVTGFSVTAQHSE